MSSIDEVRNRTIHGVLKQKVAQCGSRVFFYFKDQSFTYEDLDRESDRVAAGLQNLGIGKGDKVAIIMSNRPEFLFLWFGLSKLGAVEVPVNTAHRGDLLTYMMDKSDSRALVVEAGFMDRVAPVLGDLPQLEQLIVLGDPETTLPETEKKVFDYGNVCDNDGNFDAPSVIWSDPFVIMFTSGTTGPSKGSLMPQNYALFMGKVCMETAGIRMRTAFTTPFPCFTETRSYSPPCRRS